MLGIEDLGHLLLASKVHDQRAGLGSKAAGTLRYGVEWHQKQRLNLLCHTAVSWITFCVTEDLYLVEVAEKNDSPASRVTYLVR